MHCEEEHSPLIRAIRLEKNKRKAINTFQLFWSFSSDGREPPKAMNIAVNFFIPSTQSILRMLNVPIGKQSYSRVSHGYYCSSPMPLLSAALFTEAKGGSSVRPLELQNRRSISSKPALSSLPGLQGAAGAQLHDTEGNTKITAGLLHPASVQRHSRSAILRIFLHH